MIIVFSAHDGIHGRELWISDGTEEGTRLLKDINNKTGKHSDPEGFTELNGKLIFMASDGIHGKELWVTDGSENGTMLLKDIFQGHKSSWPEDYIEWNGKAYFRANDGVHGGELWVTDGSETDTRMLKDIWSGELSSNPKGFPEFKGMLYFRANDGVYGEELWVTNGTEEGTRLVVDINPGYFSSDHEYFFNSTSPRELTVFNEKLVFSADDGVNGIELWISDGSDEGTKLLKDIHQGIYAELSPSRRYDSSRPSKFTELGGMLFFGADDGVHGDELWVTDGTEEGTQLVMDINPSRGDIPGSRDSRNRSAPYQYGLTKLGDKLIFAATDGVRGEELWQIYAR